jgi:hypothetical protein
MLLLTSVVAAPNKGQNAHPLPGECGQIAVVPE